MANGQIEWLSEPTLLPYAEKYNPLEAAWQELPQRPEPQPIAYVAVTTLQDFLYLIGGLQLHNDRSTTTVSLMQRFNT